MAEKQKKNSSSVHPSQGRDEVPISVGEIGTRIAEVADVLRGKSALARSCNVSPSVIGK